jgi:hypothetical protein
LNAIVPVHFGERASLIGIVAGNFTLIVAYFFGWATIGELIFAYWMHSVVIGVFHFWRMRSLRQFSSEGLKSNGKPVPETTQGRNSTAWFFVFHYGIFHFVYFAFLSQVATTSFGVWMSVGLFSLVFAEWSSARDHIRTDRDWKPNIGTLLFQPYIRIVPMHIALIFSAIGGAFLLLVFKVVADVGMLMVDDHMKKSECEARW